MKRLRYLIPLMFFVIGVLFSVCGDASAVGRPVKEAYSEPIKIAYLPYQIGDTVGAAWGVGMDRELSAFPNVTLQKFDGQASAETQVRIMSELINQKYDAIILQAGDSAALAHSTREAEEAGIPVITLNLGVDTSHAGHIAMVDYEAGALVASEIAKAIKGEGNVVIIQATPGNTRGELLESGFRDEMSKHPNVNILESQTGEWMTEKANVVMTDFLTKYPKINGVFCHNDAMAAGASQAAAAVGRLEEMVIWGADGEAKALEYIEEGRLAGTIYTNCYDQGATAARLALYLIGGGVDTSAYTTTPIIKMSPIIATPDTVMNIGPSIRW